MHQRSCLYQIINILNQLIALLLQYMNQAADVSKINPVLFFTDLHFSSHSKFFRNHLAHIAFKNVTDPILLHMYKPCQSKCIFSKAMIG